MHPRHPRHKLRASENHSSTPEDIVDQVQHHEDPMRVRAIANADKFERRMRIRNAQLSDNAQHSHQSDLERQPARPPDGQSDAPAVGVCSCDDALVDPPAQKISVNCVWMTMNGHSRRYKVNSHPTREHRRTRQPSSNRSIGNHEHLRLLGVFGEVSLLNPDSDEDDAAEEDREADDDAVAIGLGEELDSHLPRRV